MSQWNHSRRPRPGHRTGGPERPIADALLKVVDAGLAAVVFVGPHLLGGRHMLGRFAILAFCVATATAWFLRQCFVNNPRWVPHSSFGLLLSALIVVAFQVIPLPQAWIDVLVPERAATLSLWNGGDATISLGSWRTLSLSPEETKLALATLVSYALLFVTAIQRIERFDDVKRILAWVAASAIVVALFAVVQYLSSNGKFFWLYAHPYADTQLVLKGAFTNRNHFAHFLVLGLASLLALLMLARTDKPQSRAKTGGWSRDSDVRPFSRSHYLTMAMCTGLTLLLFGVMASLSRGGMLAAAGATGVFTVVCARERLLRASHFFAVAIFLLLMVAILSLSGSYEMVADRVETLTTNSFDDMDVGGGRRAIWAANLLAFQASPLTGWGAGTHRFVYPLFMDRPIPNEFTHAENGYLQIGLEAGVPGLILVAGAILACCFCSIRVLRSEMAGQHMRIATGGIAAAITASVVHSIVDFVWFIPACMSVTVLLAACLIRLSQLATDIAGRPAHQIAFTPLARFNLTLATSLAGLWIIQVTYPAAATSLKWDTYLRADRARQSADASQFSTVENEDGDGSDSVDLNSVVVQESLLAVVRDYPNSARAHLRLASYLLARFEELQQRSDNAMNISQIREAADASQFASPQALHDWLKQAFGGNCRLLYMARAHALAALRLCPLEGQAYLYLAELAFLEGRGPAGYAAYAEQALRVRPADADVLFAVGKNELVAGDVDSALRHWSQAYRGPGNHQQHIIQILAGRMSAVNFLDVFAPDWRTLGLLWESYKQAGNTADLKAILPYAQTLAKEDTSKVRPALAGKYWHDLARMQLEMEDPQGALESLQHAYAAFPESVNTRRLLGRCLMRFEQFELAESHLRWCAQQSPESKTIRAELLQATRGKMQQLARTTHSSTK